MRGEMGVNNISHYNYSHTATPIHYQPSYSPPSLSSSLYFPSVFTPGLCLPSLFDMITPFTLFSLTLNLSFNPTSLKKISSLLTMK